jgi:putative sterol carrier protein
VSGDKPAPNGNQQKFAWIYALGADKTLSAPAKTVATLTALKLAGHKGYFKATHKHIAALCGMTYITVRRAADELYREKYWDIDAASGGTNTYFIIPPADRIEDWLDAERDHRQLCQKWLSAENQFVQKWLSAEKQFVQKWLDAEKEFVAEWLLAELDACDEYKLKVFNAVYDRCEDSEFAIGAATAAWKDHQAGKLPPAHALQAIADMPQEALPEPDQSTEMSRPLLTREQTPAQR